LALFARALLAFVACPGVVAVAVPAVVAWVNADPANLRPGGLLPLSGGCALLLWCVRDFYVAGKGTLAPWDPPRRLVVIGLYRWSRNPMYVAVALILVGWAWTFGLPVLWAYAVIVMIAFHLRVVLGEEPWLARTHREAWHRYTRSVRRWL
jgi:protein-S-isoprenylcysteine O-methyltransferase Ste14